MRYAERNHGFRNFRICLTAYCKNDLRFLFVLEHVCKQNLTYKTMSGSELELEYIGQLTDLEKKALHIAQTHLETSFNLLCYY